VDIKIQIKIQILCFHYSTATSQVLGSKTRLASKFELRDTSQAQKSLAKARIFRAPTSCGRYFSFSLADEEKYVLVMAIAAQKERDVVNCDL
jgi:hypothetical protein